MTDPAGRRHSQTPRAWLHGLGIYLGFTAVGNLIWETLQLPLYTIWNTGSQREQAWAVIHCTLGDLLIALSTLTLALIIIGDRMWPTRRFWNVAALAMILGVGYTVFSEWLNVVVRAAWTYSELMPVVSLFGLKIGLSPLGQWVIVPAVALGITRQMTVAQIDGDSE